MGRQPYLLPLRIVETSFQLCIAQSAVVQRSVGKGVLLTVTTIETEHRPCRRQYPHHGRGPLVGQSQHRSPRTMGVCPELPPTGIYGQRGLSPEGSNLQVAVECAYGVGTDHLVLLFGHGQRQRTVHVGLYGAGRHAIAAQTGHHRGKNQREQNRCSMVLFHIWGKDN